MANEVSEVTRRAIVDYLLASHTVWAGGLDEDDFLARLYDLSQVRSTDIRYKSARADIRQHRKSFQDWPDDWIFTDSRFNLFWASDDRFLGFLTETVHPVVREPDSARELVAEYNSRLRTDGWELVASSQISGKPLYKAMKVAGRAEVLSEPTGWPKVDRQRQEIRMRLDAAESEEQFQAIGLICREVLISLAQAVFDPVRHRTPDGIDPSETDAARMLEAFFASELGGSANEESRAYARSTLKLTVALQHKRTADWRIAALCAEATYSVVNVTALLAGRR
jgi:hypothetical protein